MKLDIGKVNLVLDNISKTLVEKNRKYGNSALEPINVFSKDDATTGIRVRLDDKVNRLRNNPKIAKNDLYDILGYSFLLILSESPAYRHIDKTFAEKVELIRCGIFSFIDRGLLENKLGNEARNGEFHVFSDELMGDTDDDSVRFLNSIEDWLCEIKKCGGKCDTQFVLHLMMDIVCYFVSVDITDFSDLID